MPPIFFNVQERYVRALTLHQGGQLEEAEAAYREVIQFNPGIWEPWHNLGIVLRQRGKVEEAIECYRRALAIKPEFAPFYNEIGENYRLMGLAHEALEAYDRALAIDPGYLTCMNNRGMVLQLLGRLSEAMRAWETIVETLTRNPEQALSSTTLTGSPAMVKLLGAAYINLGNAAMEFGRQREAMEFHRRVWEIDAENRVGYSNWLRNQASVSDAAPDLAAFAGFWNRACGGVVAVRHPRGAGPEKVLRIGFVSGDFRRHSVSYFLQGLFEHFDRSLFVFVCYANVAHADEVTAEFQSRVSAWRNIVGWSDAAVAAQVQRDGIDILVDLSGHTAENRLGVFAYKAAPVQVTYLGSPITNGAPGKLIDYRVTDGLADPPGMTEGHFTETLCRLGRPAWCYRPPRANDAGIGKMREAGAAFTFGVFNAFGKITPEMLGLWMRILSDTPGSQLVVKGLGLGDEEFRREFAERFSAAGIDAGRLTLLARCTDVEEHLAVLRGVDLALDSFPYHGTTTTCECLWMNVPVLTLAGKSHHSRVGVSLLTAVGLEAMIARSAEEYHAVAVRLATHAAEVETLRRDLRGRLERSPLMDEKGFAAEFTDALRRMWRVHCGVA